MGNHGDTGKLLEEVLAIPTTGVHGMKSAVRFEDEFGSMIVLDNPTRLKDSSGRDVDFIMDQELDFIAIEEAEAILAKQKKKVR